MTTGTCRSPNKIRHDSRPAALAAIRALYKAGRGNPDYSAYRCGDHWHVGHDVVHFGKRISRALKAGKGSNTTFARNRRTAR